MHPKSPLYIVLMAVLVTHDGQASDEEASSEPRALELPGLLGGLPKIGESILSVGNNNLRQPLESLLGGLNVKKMMPTSITATTTTTTTTPSPLVELTQNIENLGHKLMPSSKLAQTPIKLLNGILVGATEVGASGAKSVSNTADGIAKVTKTGTKTIASGLDPESSAASKEKMDDSENYEFLDIDGSLIHRRPKYYSRECHFRMACEAGKLMKPFTEKVSKEVETNRLLQDLQNRYTRAFTYGSLEGNCEKYYCAFLALFGGPVGMASGMAEIVNRVANPDMYEGVGF